MSRSNINQMNIGQFWQNLISYSADNRELLLTEQELRAMHQLGIIQKKYSLEQWFQSVSQFREAENYYFKKDDFLSLKLFFSFDKISKYLDPFAFPQQWQALNWLEGFYQEALQYLIRVDHIQWQAIKLEWTQQKIITEKGIFVGEGFKKNIIQLLYEKATPLRQMEMKLHFNSEEQAQYYSKIFKEQLNEAKSNFDGKNIGGYSKVSLTAITKEGPSLSPETDDAELLDFLSQWKE